MLLPACTAIGYAGVAGAARAGNTGSRNQTLPAVPNSTGKFPGLTDVEIVRPWFDPQMLIGMFMPSRTVAMAYEPRKTDLPFSPRIHFIGPTRPPLGLQVNPADGEKLVQSVLNACVE